MTGSWVVERVKGHRVEFIALAKVVAAQFQSHVELVM